MDKVFRRKVGLIAITVAVCLAAIGHWLPQTNMRWFAWGAAAGLLLPVALFAIKHIWDRGPRTPEQVRQNINSNRKWIKWIAFCTVPLGSVIGSAFAIFAPDHINWLAGGLALGILGLPIFLFAQAMLQPGKAKPRDKQFPLEPKR
jgi:MFS family permease